MFGSYGKDCFKKLFPRNMFVERTKKNRTKRRKHLRVKKQCFWRDSVKQMDLQG